jgi:two-component system, sensor histidine kinase and response regulator
MDSLSDKVIHLQEPVNDTIFSILIVEDNLGDVVIVRELLKSSGALFSLTHVSTLREALLLSISSQFDVILLDLGLPDSIGLETLKKTQLFQVVPPVVVMTGLDDEETALESLREGAQDYLVKNRLTSENILRAIKYGIERKKLQNFQKKNTRQFSTLSRATASLNESEDISVTYSVICDNIILLLDKAAVIAVGFSNKQTFHDSNTELFEPVFKKIRILSGLEILELIPEIVDRKRKVLDLFNDGILHRINGGIYELFEGYIDDRNCQELSYITDKSYIYTIGFLRNENYYGGAIIFSQLLIVDEDIKIIETFCNQASLSIYRRSIEKDLRISESRYRKLNAELEQKVKDRTQDLESVNERLNQELTERTLVEEALIKSEALLIELNASKDKFFNILAHDLKNPFTSLLGSTELLFDNIDQMDKEKIRILAQILNDSAKSGYEILLNLLDWSRSQTGILKINPERISIKELIDENISNLQLAANIKEIDIRSEIEDDLYLFGDKNMINTILRNLFSNGLKFTHKGGKVTVGAFTTELEAIIWVRDTGIGISEENIKKLFRIDVIFQLPGTNKEQGTGLGLMLCKEFVEKLHGKIWVESTENVGSEFKFSLPLDIPH